MILRTTSFDEKTTYGTVDTETGELTTDDATLRGLWDQHERDQCSRLRISETMFVSRR